MGSGDWAMGSKSDPQLCVSVGRVALRQLAMCSLASCCSLPLPSVGFLSSFPASKLFSLLALCPCKLHQPVLLFV